MSSEHGSGSPDTVGRPEVEGGDLVDAGEGSSVGTSQIIAAAGQEGIHTLQIPESPPEGADSQAEITLRRPESDLDAASSSYVPSLCSPTTRDSLDEGYDPNETLKITVYDNEDIKFTSRSMYHDDFDEEEDEEEDSDNKDVVYISSHSSSGPASGHPSGQPSANLNQLRDRLRESHDDDGDVVYISSTSASHVSRNDNDESRRVSITDDVNANQVVVNQDQERDVVQLHLSYNDSSDVEIYQLPPVGPPPHVVARQGALDEQSERVSESIDALEQLDSDIVEIEPNKFTIVRDRENNDEKIKLLDFRHQIDYGELDKFASTESDIRVCNDILNSISFDEISLTSLRKLRHSHLKLRKMSKIDSTDSDTKVFNEIWNAVKQDKFGTITDSSLDSDKQVFKVLNQSLSLDSGTSVSSSRVPMQTIPEDRVSSLSSAGGSESLAMPENPVPSPIYYPASGTGIPPPPDSDVVSIKTPLDTARTDASDKSILALREKCSSRQQKCSCDVIIFNSQYFSMNSTYEQSF